MQQQQQQQQQQLRVPFVILSLVAIVVASASSLVAMRPAKYVVLPATDEMALVSKGTKDHDDILKKKKKKRSLKNHSTAPSPGTNDTTSTRPHKDPRPLMMKNDQPAVLPPIDATVPLKPVDVFHPGLEQLDEFCVSWNLNMDSWWTHHVEWSVVRETDDMFCFAKEDSRRTQLLRQIYNNQFVTGNCSDVHTKHMWSSGLGADLLNLIDGLRYGLQQKRPFQVRFHPNNDVDPHKAWHYAAMKDGSRPICPSKDMFCYFLPFSACQAGDDIDMSAFRLEVPDGHKAAWLYDYLMRPQQWLRRRLYEYMRDQALNITTPCAVVHVRRSDVVLHQAHSRKYFAVEEYLERMRAKNVDRKNVLLLTDDANAIDEAVQLHKDYKWMYIERKRHRGAEGGWENQIPSKDPIEEMVAIMASFRMVQQCDVLVHGFSAFSDMLYWNMLLVGDGTTRVRVDEGKEVFNKNNTESVHALTKRLKQQGLSVSEKTNGKERRRRHRRV